MTITNMPAMIAANNLSASYEASGESMMAIASGTGGGSIVDSPNAQLSMSMLDMALETQKGINFDMFA